MGKVSLKALQKAELGESKLQTGVVEIEEVEVFNGKNSTSDAEFSVLNLKGTITTKGVDGAEQKFPWSFNKLRGHYDREVDGESKTYPNSLNIRLDSKGAIEAKSILGRFMSKYNISKIDEFMGKNLKCVRENEIWKIDAKV